MLLIASLRGFVERVALPRAECEECTGRLRLLIEPPTALVASFAWESEDDTITSINVGDGGSCLVSRLAASDNASDARLHRAQQYEPGL